MQRKSWKDSHQIEIQVTSGEAEEIMIGARGQRGTWPYLSDFCFYAENVFLHYLRI